MHPGNFTGPVFGIDEDKLRLGIRVKKSHYSELVTYCYRHGLKEQALIFEKQLRNVIEIEQYIAQYSLEQYRRLAEEYFETSEKIYWWQYIVSLDKCVRL
jgi:hypothetical protein